MPDDVVAGERQHLESTVSIEAAPNGDQGARIAQGGVEAVVAMLISAEHSGIGSTFSSASASEA